MIYFNLILSFIQISFAIEYKNFTVKELPKLISITEKKGILVSSKCNNCIAIQQTKNKKKFTEWTNTQKNKTLIGNPASSLCHFLDGNNINLKAYNNSDEGFCLFKDKSLISSMQLYWKLENK